jgi:tetratricopeptide (TPR) repeat protein
MKHLILILLSVLFSRIEAQTNSERLDQASQMGSQNPDKAIEQLQLILKSELDTTVVYARAFFNIAVLYSVKGDVANTQLWYQKIMDSKLNSKHPGESFFETYACYQHNAAMQLGIFLHNNRFYKEALESFEWARDKYPYESGSGTSLGNRANAIDVWRSRCYFGLAQEDEAIVTLISSSFNCYAPMKNQLDEYIKQFAQTYGKKKFKKTLEKGLKGIHKQGVVTDAIVGQRVLWVVPFNSVFITLCMEEKDDSKEAVQQLISAASWYP